MTINGACYIRVSTEEQTEYSPDAQLRCLKDYAGKNDISLAAEHIYIDEGISGRKADKRPAFMKMVSAAKTTPKPFDVILVHKFDRFARSREDSVVYKSLLRKEAGIKVISITETIEDDKFAIILEAMLEAMAEYYSLNLGEEVKKGMTEKALRGELQTPAPLGYRIKNGLLTPKEDEATAIRLIFEKFVHEGITPRQIALYMNRMGYKTQKGNAFSARSILYILHNPTYAGKIRWTPTGSVVCKRDFNHPDTLIMEGKHKPVISEALWSESESLLQRREKKQMPKYIASSAINTHWLRGLLVCAACRSVLSFGKGNKGRQSAYRCGRYLTGGCTEPQRVTISIIEKVVLNALSEDAQILPKMSFVKKTSDVKQAAALLEYEKRIGKLKVQLEKASEFALSGIDSPEEYQCNKKRIKEGIQELQYEMEQLHPTSQDAKNVVDRVSGITDILTSNAGYHEKHRALCEIINKMVYDKKRGRLEIYYYIM